ncbi:hypothetical protein [Paraburkholderia sp. 2C]
MFNIQSPLSRAWEEGLQSVIGIRAVMRHSVELVPMLRHIDVNDFCYTADIYKGQ